MIKHGWNPPRAPIPLLQELVWPDEWKILVACIMLNCTTRKQVEGVIWEFFKRWPTPKQFLAAHPNEIEALIKPLGFGKKRTHKLLQFTIEFLGDWTDASQLYGIGEYAARCHEMLCRGIIGNEPPKDHALVYLWEWLKQHEASSEPRRD